MEKQGIRPNEATLVSVLTACIHSGLVNEGCQLFKSMVSDYKMQLKIGHFGCLIDLLSRAGLLHQAEEFIQLLLPEERLIAYKTLLSACIKYSEFDFGKKVANEMSKLSSNSHETHILLSNFYALADGRTELHSFSVFKQQNHVFIIQSVKAGHFVEEKLMFVTYSSGLTFYQIATHCESKRF
uniref:Pentacotripeptide-repeat region of PRORP domain-containing protein n=1 Tax=Salix viminalis TaxID=40686 RepID=A0A6N2LIN5_SALVM